MRIAKKLFSNIHKKEDGITGLETAIILIAFVIVASVFAFVVLSTGLFSADRGKETVFAGLEKARGNMEVRGAITVMDGNGDGDIDDQANAPDPNDSIVFNIANAAGGEPISVDELATTNSTVINYIDAQDRVPDTDYTVNEILGDADSLLEPGELFEITVELPTGSSLVANETWTLEVVPPAGGVSLIARTMPPEIDAVMDLH
jgi:flagellin FlaB